MFCRDVKINAIRDNKIPKHVTDQNTLQILMENMKKMNTEQQKAQNVISILKLVISFVLFVQKSNKHFNSIKFMSS